jgi:3-oxoacyl-[acyl-carrier-protein] synthase-3
MRIAVPGPTRHCRILALGTYRPARVVGNDEIGPRLCVSDEWIRARTGIIARRFASAHESLLDMAATAAAKALAEAGMAADDVSVVLAASMTHLYQAPPLAAEVAHRIGARCAAAADLSAACAGFCYSLGVAASMVASGAAQSVLVVAAERMSDLIDMTDRGTAIIFGDGAAAVLLGPSSTPAVGPVVWGSDVDRIGAIGQPRSWRSLHDDPEAGWPFLRMSGGEVYRWVTSEVAPIARRALAAAGVTVADLAAFIPHQANLRLVESLAKALDLPDSVAVARDVVTSGNTSAASIPLAMEELLRSGRAQRGDLALLVGFGSGLMYAAQVAELP